LLAPLGYKKKVAILKKELKTNESVKNKLKGVETYLSVIKNSNKHS